MTSAEIVSKAKSVAAELESLRIEIGLDKPRLSLLAHTLSAKRDIELMLKDLQSDQVSSVTNH